MLYSFYTFIIEFRKAFVNGLIAQSVLTDGEKGSGVAPKWGALVASMTGILFACGASGMYVAH